MHLDNEKGFLLSYFITGYNLPGFVNSYLVTAGFF